MLYICISKNNNFFYRSNESLYSILEIILISSRIKGYKTVISSLTFVVFALMYKTAMRVGEENSLTM